MIYVYPQAEPFILKGDTNTALLLLHGFTASPSEIYPLARTINEMNSCTISGIVLPGHGSSPEILNRCRWADWYRAVEIELQYLFDQYERVFVGGLSMGALLAIYAGIQMTGLQGVISINAPIYNKKPLLSAFAPLFAPIRPYYPKQVDKEMLSLEKAGRFAYRVMPVKAFQSLMNLRRKVMQDIGQLKAPLFIIQSRQDESVDPGSGRYLYNQTRQNGSVLIELEESRHIATMGPEKERIAQEIIDFMT